MFCKSCGKEIAENAVVCPHCGADTGFEANAQVPPPDPFAAAPEKKVKYCANCGKEIDENAVICVHCGVATGTPVNNNANVAALPKKKVNGLAIAGLAVGLVGLFGGNYLFLIPGIVGLILSIVGMVKAKSCSLYGLAIAALVVSVCSFFIWLIIWICAFGIIFAAIAGGAYPDINYYSLNLIRLFCRI